MPGHPDIILDRSSPIPLYFQVAEQIERAIRSGELAPGDRIENEVALAHGLGLSRPTMRQAIQVLVDKGMLVRKRGVGTQVVHGTVRRSVELTSLHDDLASAGQDPRTQLLSLGREAADEEVALELQAVVGAEVWMVERVRFIGAQPLALMRNYLPVDAMDLSTVDFESEGLYSAMRRAGITMRVAKQRISARQASTREATLLNERRNAPLLTMQRTAYDDGGRAVEFGRHAYRTALYQFELTLVDR
ncbi:MAG: GntR family transcriptional regulator [Aeromicrobium sp.]